MSKLTQLQANVAKLIRAYETLKRENKMLRKENIQLREQRVEMQSKQQLAKEKLAAVMSKIEQEVTT